MAEKMQLKENIALDLAPFNLQMMSWDSSDFSKEIKSSITIVWFIKTLNKNHNKRNPPFLKRKRNGEVSGDWGHRSEYAFVSIYG